MSQLDLERNPWKSLADFLISKTSVAALATAIETEGIRTWDRFGRMGPATKDDDNAARAFDLLALVYKNEIEAQNNNDQESLGRLEEFIEDYDGPLVQFGWPTDECPDFEKYKPGYSVPGTVKRAGELHEEDALLTRARKSLEAMIRALMHLAKLDTSPIMPYKVAEIISPLTNQDQTKVLDTKTIANHLKRIYHLPSS